MSPEDALASMTMGSTFCEVNMGWPESEMMRRKKWTPEFEPNLSNSECRDAPTHVFISKRFCPLTSVLERDFAENL